MSSVQNTGDSNLIEPVIGTKPTTDSITFNPHIAKPIDNEVLSKINVTLLTPKQIEQLKNFKASDSVNEILRTVKLLEQVKPIPSFRAKALLATTGKDFVIRKDKSDSQAIFTLCFKSDTEGYMEAKIMHDGARSFRLLGSLEWSSLDQLIEQYRTQISVRYEYAEDRFYPDKQIRWEMDDIQKLSLWRDVDEKTAESLIKAPGGPYFLLYPSTKDDEFCVSYRDKDRVQPKTFAVDSKEITPFLSKLGKQARNVRFKEEAGVVTELFKTIQKNSGGIYQSSRNDKRKHTYTKIEESGIFRHFHGKTARFDSKPGFVGEGAFKIASEIEEVTGKESFVRSVHRANTPEAKEFLNEMPPTDNWLRPYLFEFEGKKIEFTKKMDMDLQEALTTLLPEEKLGWMEQMVVAVKDFHDNGWSHGDIKLENFLITRFPDGSFKIRLTDIDFVNRLVNPNEPVGHKAIFNDEFNRDYHHPALGTELERKELAATDIYSLGIAILCIYAGENLNIDKVDVFYEEQKDSQNPLIKCICQMIDPDLKNKPKLDEVLSIIRSSYEQH